MRRVILGGMRAHARRMVATTLAVVFGVAFVAGTLIFGATARAGFYDSYARLAAHIDADVLAPTGHDGTPRLLTPAQVSAVVAVPGVAEVDARMSAPLPLVGSDGRLVTNFGQAGVVLSTDGDARLRGYDVRGGLPEAPGQAALDTETAAHQHVRIGDQITVVDSHGGRHAYTLVGLLDLGTSKQYSGESVVGLPATEISRLTGVTGYVEIAVGATASTSPTALAGRIRQALGSGPTVETGDQRREDLANDATSVAAQFQTVLLIFGVVSLVVAAFVIYNTFAILLAQRVRETALLRLVGAGRAQVFASVLAESAAIGVIGGVAGVVAGAGFAAGLLALLNGVIHAGIPASGVVLTASPVVSGLLLGILVTVVAALLPALRATRTAPLAALRDMATGKVSSRRARLVRLAVAVLLAALGAVLTVAGSRDSDARAGALSIVAGGVVVFLGILAAGPLYIGRLVAVLGALPGRLLGTPARLAAANGRRNPGRTAVTAAALMIGVGIMALFSVLLASIRATAERQIGAHYPVDYVISGVQYDNGRTAPVPAGYASGLRALPQFRGVAEVRVVDVTIGGTSGKVAAVDPGSLGTLVKPNMKTGSASDLAMGTAIVDAGSRFAGTVTVAVGGHTAALRVVGTADNTVPPDIKVDALVTWDQLTALAGPGDDAVVMAKAAPGVTPVASRDALDRLDDGYPLLTVSSAADLRSDLDSTVNGLIALFGGLIATAVLIALFGIANTLSLSVVERTRESATVRALGFTRTQLRVSLLIEALLLGVAGALVGVTVAVVYGPLIMHEVLLRVGASVVVPWSWLAGIVAVAGLAATLAAVVPARRAAGASIVAAMAES